MHSSTELADRTLVLLEELREDDVYGILNTIIKPTGRPDEVQAYLEALQMLKAKGLIDIVVGRFASKDDHGVSEDALPALWAKLSGQFHVHSNGFWTSEKGTPHENCARVALTELGLEKANLVLESRGSTWW